MCTILSFAARAAALGRPLPANTDIPFIGPMPSVGTLGWLLSVDSSPLCFGEVIAVGVGARGDQLTILDTEDGEPCWYTGPIRDFVAGDGPEKLA